MNPKKQKYTPRERYKARWAYVFLAPWLLMFLIFYAYPLIYGTIVSFTNYTIGSMKWIGLENYRTIFTDYRFWRSLRATIFYMLIVMPLQVFVPLWIANTIQAYKRGFNTAVKLVAYIPGVTCSVALVLAWRFMLDPNIGFVTSFLKKIFGARFSPFNTASTAIPIIAVLIAFTNLGATLIIYSAALNAIPADYYEAAELDGATRWDQLTKITIPLLQPTIVYVFITSTIGALQIFVIPQLMTQGGPNFMTSTVLLLIYSAAFGDNKFGYASALGVILFLITAIFAMFQFRITRRDTVEY
ncbi:MAG: sugar ABC transporter permease [Lachnospiraceae bacterium]|nr:sugar ABC transporter permease [Lachnospiraceae bacterium]